MTRTVLSPLDRLHEMFHKFHNPKQFLMFSGRAIRVTTASPTTTASDADKTLTDAEANAMHIKVVDALKTQLQATVRE
jgi:hypothetical protein